MKRFVKIGTPLLAAALAAVALSGMARPFDKEDDRAKAAGPVTTLWAVPKENGKVMLIEQGKAKPITVTVGSNTVLGGVCHDCHLFQQFKASESAKECKTCPCYKPNVECIAWTPVKPKTWEAMLQALPPGIALRVQYNEAGKPESGVKTLTADHRTVLLPVEGLANKSPDQLMQLVKPFGGVKAEMVGNGKQLLIDMKEDWKLDREARFEKALTDVGARVTFNESKSTQQ